MKSHYSVIKILILILIPLTLIGCDPPDLNIKIYYSRPDLNGLYRKQNNELVRYEDTRAYRCLNPSDWEALLNYINALKN